MKDNSTEAILQTDAYLKDYTMCSERGNKVMIAVMKTEGAQKTCGRNFVIRILKDFFYRREKEVERNKRRRSITISRMKMSGKLWKYFENFKYDFVPRNYVFLARNFDAKFNWYADGIFDDAFDEIKKL